MTPNTSLHDHQCREPTPESADAFHPKVEFASRNDHTHSRAHSSDHSNAMKQRHHATAQLLLTTPYCNNSSPLSQWTLCVPSKNAVRNCPVEASHHAPEESSAALTPCSIPQVDQASENHILVFPIPKGLPTKALGCFAQRGYPGSSSKPFLPTLNGLPRVSFALRHFKKHLHRCLGNPLWGWGNLRGKIRNSSSIFPNLIALLHSRSNCKCESVFIRLLSKNFHVPVRKWKQCCFTRSYNS